MTAVKKLRTQNGPKSWNKIAHTWRYVAIVVYFVHFLLCFLFHPVLALFLTNFWHFSALLVSFPHICIWHLFGPFLAIGLLLLVFFWLLCIFWSAFAILVNFWQFFWPHVINFSNFAFCINLMHFHQLQQFLVICDLGSPSA